MYTRKDIPFNVATLSFSDTELEAAFRADYFEKNIRDIRRYLLLGLLLYGMFGIHDYWIIPDILRQAWSIRYLLVCPLLLGIYLFSYSKTYFQAMQYSLFLAGFAAGAGIVIMSIKAAPPGNSLYYAGLLLCLLFYFRLRFVTASLLSWSLFILYVTAAFLTIGTPTLVLFSNSFIFLSFIITGMFACYTMERYYRSDFLLRRTIQQQNHEISASNQALGKEILDHKQAVEENIRLKAQLSLAQKTEAVGQLAGGIAHEFTNILTAVVGYANYLQMKLDKDDPLASYTGNIITSANRAARLTNDLLAFSRKKQSEPRITNLNEIIQKAENFLPLMAGKKIRVSIVVCDRPLIALADEVLLEQVLVNLAANARDAMPGGGVLSITTDLLELNREVPRASGTAQPGRYGRITVTDMGVGMSENVQARIFEPFFTTKEPGKGTGLGISMIYSVISQHNGFIDFSSRIGNGTTFRLLIPLINEEIP
ncbi:MAG: ATP-binding protein [Geobacteraceae bacterium]|nr:ATP-binding protein [Geobacteraceae bacterium]